MRCYVIQGGKIHDLPEKLVGKLIDSSLFEFKMSGRAFRKAINKEYESLAKRINDEELNDFEDINQPLPKSNLFDLVCKVYYLIQISWSNIFQNSINNKLNEVTDNTENRNSDENASEPEINNV
jgi:hypothetical protein